MIKIRKSKKTLDKILVTRSSWDKFLRIAVNSEPDLDTINEGDVLKHRYKDFAYIVKKVISDRSIFFHEIVKLEGLDFSYSTGDFIKIANAGEYELVST